MDFENRALAYIRKQNMLKRGDRILAGISGGADSVCMLAVLLRLAPTIGFGIFAVHINHGIRKEGAVHDENFVKDFCEKHGVPFFCVHGDIPALAAENGETEEEAGRNFRYDTFLKLAEKLDCNRIAVAHNSDDNAETVLFNIFRGSGISGVRGIRPVRAFREGKPELIRPLLCFSRSEIEEYLRFGGFEWCTDETNLKNDYSRNKIRNVILPMVREELNPNAAKHIGELSTQASQLEDFLRQCVDKEIKKCVFSGPDEIFLEEKHICGLHEALRSGLIRRCFEILSGRLKDVESCHIGMIEALFEKGVGKRTDLPYDMEAVRDYSGVVLRRKKTGEFFPDAADNGKNDNETGICDPAAAFEDKYFLKTIPRREAGIRYPDDSGQQWFDAGKINSVPVFRHRQPGDYLLIGPEGHKKSLNRFMIDRKIPEKNRDNIDLLADGSHILWVIGYRRDDSCYITDETESVLVAGCRHKEAASGEL